MTAYATRELVGPLGTFAPGQRLDKVPRETVDAWVRDGAAERHQQAPETADRPAPEQPEPPRETATKSAPERATRRRKG